MLTATCSGVCGTGACGVGGGACGCALGARGFLGAGSFIFLVGGSFNTVGSGRGGCSITCVGMGMSVW